MPVLNIFPDYLIEDITPYTTCASSNILLYLMLGTQIATLLMVGAAVMNLSNKVNRMYEWVSRTDDDGVLLIYGSMLKPHIDSIGRLVELANHRITEFKIKN